MLTSQSVPQHFKESSVHANHSSWNNSVRIKLLVLWPENQSLISGSGREFSLLHSICSESEIDPASYWVDLIFSRGKGRGTCSCSSAYIQDRSTVLTIVRALSVQPCGIALDLAQWHCTTQHAFHSEEENQTYEISMLYACTCVYVCVYVYAYRACTYVCMYVWIYLCTCVYVYACVHVFMYITAMHTCVHVCVYLCMCVHMCVCAYM